MTILSSTFTHRETPLIIGVDNGGGCLRIKRIYTEWLGIPDKRNRNILKYILTTLKQLLLKYLHRTVLS